MERGAMLWVFVGALRAELLVGRGDGHSWIVWRMMLLVVSGNEDDCDFANPANSQERITCTGVIVGGAGQLLWHCQQLSLQRMKDEDIMGSMVSK
eukprot:scaffold9371_cov66-Cyclotella_meneghiniana.AAC.13